MADWIALLGAVLPFVAIIVPASMSIDVLNRQERVDTARARDSRRASVILQSLDVLPARAGCKALCELAPAVLAQTCQDLARQR